MADAAKGIQTWASLFNISLEMWFTRQNLLNLPAGFIQIGKYQ